MQNLTKISYSIPEACLVLGICKDTLYDEINSGRIKTFKVGQRRRFISHEAMQQFIRDREAATA